MKTFRSDENQKEKKTQTTQSVNTKHTVKKKKKKIYSAKAKVAKKISRPKNVRAIESRNYNHQDFEKQLIMNRKEMVANISSKEK